MYGVLQLQNMNKYEWNLLTQNCFKIVGIEFLFTKIQEELYKLNHWFWWNSMNVLFIYNILKSTNPLSTKKNNE